MRNKKTLLSWLLVMLMGIIVHTGTVNAHTMTLAEATLRVEKFPEHNVLIVPGKSTLGAVRAILGDDFKLNEYRNEWLRAVGYEYHGLSFLANEKADNESATDELVVVGYDVDTVGLSTPSNFYVSAPYQKVVAKYGEGKKYVRESDNLYIYDFGGRELSFTVDKQGKITQISFRTEI